MTLHMADRSIKHLVGVLEDILVMVDQYFISGDFVILDMEEDTKVPIILGRPFLTTAGALIDVKGGKLVMERWGEGKYDDSPETIASLAPLEEEQAPKVELKPLPSSLMYDFLDSNSSYPVIISSSLQEEQVEKLLTVFKKHKKVIGYKIGDLISIDPKYYMHRIYLEDDAKPTVELFRRLNPNLKDVVKNEILKLLDADIIYPISDRKWASPIHVVPKKGGITIVENENNKLIPTRLVTGHRMCIDYRKLNKSTRKDHYPLRFIDQLYERMSNNEYFYFLDGFSGYFHISIHPDDQEMTTFTCQYGTFAFKRMLFGVRRLILCSTRRSVTSWLLRELLLGTRRFIKDFSNLAKLLTHLLTKDVVFIFYESCLVAFEKLKEALCQAPIIQPLDWPLPFELMCDASDYAVGAVLCQKRNRNYHVIHYASHTLDEVQVNYATTEKELLAIFVSEKDAKPRLIRWVLLLQEFDLEIRDKKGIENVVADHLSRLEGREKDELPIDDSFKGETLLAVSASGEDSVPWFADIVNYLVSGYFPKDFNYNKKKRFIHDVRDYFWDEALPFKICPDGIVRRCIPEEEFFSVLNHCHASLYGGHMSADRTALKVLQSGLFWPTLFSTAKDFVSKCDSCQRTCTIGKRHEMPQRGILEVELFDVWGMDFMGPFPPSFGNEYILAVVDYVPKWVEAISTPRNDAKTVIKFMKRNIFFMFGMQRSFITDNGTHFCNKLLEKLLAVSKFKKKEHKFMKKEHKFMQYILSHSICGHFDSTSFVSHADMLCLYGMIKGKRVHMGVVVGNLFINQHPPKGVSLFLGPYLTRILKSTHRVRLTEPKVQGMLALTVETVQMMRQGKGEKRARVTLEPEVELEEDAYDGAELVDVVAVEGSSRGTFQQQVLAQLAAMNMKVDQIYTRMDAMEAANAQGREEARAYYEWRRSHYPPPGGP
ncbi:uncharacterized protein LOC115999477 [Ipomoea triloba]|uniref:uncharacterized protein LOC115999477 n=1 Tax=Ipomoea triloba TaxID=35885 RepID=UPI00125D5E3D|nr:uncharacterized protein LOC115999477 [Ipomoea triloba]